MCGIAGLIKRHSLIEKRELQSMLNRLQHRGPDNMGYYVHDHVGLAHARLSIIDLKGGDQPIISSNGHLALVANGEIYNYIELTQDLIKKGGLFTTRSDSESILQSYLLYGEDFVHRLNGMFAFALFDKESGKILLGRDRLGIKPLFYTISSSGVAFASEIKALIPALPHSPAINPIALCQFFHNQFNTGRETIIKGIMRVLPGEVITIDEEIGISHRQYWSPLSTELVRYSYEEAQEEFDSLFDQVIKEHIRSDVPYGLFLSGGADSAILLAMLHRFQDRPIRTFSVGFKDVKIKNELEPAQFISDQFNTRHAPFEIDSKALFNRLPYVIWATDDLMRDYACMPTSFLAEEASKELKVVFTGEGGDEVFAGYGRYRESRFQKWVKDILSPGSGGFRTRSQIKKRWLKGLFESKLDNCHGQFRNPFVQAWQSCPSNWTDIQKCQYVDMVTALPDNLLAKVDRMLMSFGLEGRVPYLDHRIVSFGLSLPNQLKVESHYGKVFLRRWAEKYLPKDYLWRRKKGFDFPAGDFFSKPALDGLGKKLQQNAAIREWFDLRWVQRLFDFQRKEGGVTRAIWCLTQFAIWHHIFIEGNGMPPSPRENPLEWIG